MTEERQDLNDPEIKALDRVADIFGKTLGVPVAPDKIKALLATLRLLDAAGYGPLKEVVKATTTMTPSFSASPSASPSEEDDSYSTLQGPWANVKTPYLTLTNNKKKSIFHQLIKKIK
jgi:hypothetical protein